MNPYPATRLLVLLQACSMYVSYVAEPGAFPSLMHPMIEGFAFHEVLLYQPRDAPKAANAMAGP